MNILKELEKSLPQDAEISEIKFEASELVLYTKNQEFFKNSEDLIKQIVSNMKKRIEVRPDLSITMDPEKTKEYILKTVSEEAGIKQIYFEPELGKVFIECLKPGLVIGKGGEVDRDIRDKSCWLPKIQRAPVLNSDIVNAVRGLLHTELDYRKRFLNSVGSKISSELPPLTTNPDEWVRLTFLGGFGHVGRSCLMVETSHSKIMLDCGVDVCSDSVPYVNAPDFDLEKLDAIVLSHAHIDHMGFIPYLYENGYKGPLYCTPPTRDLMVLLCMDFVDVAQKAGKQLWYSKKAVETAVKHSITLEYGEVSDITPDVRVTLQPSGHLLGSSLVHLHIGRGLYNILYTGDLKFVPTQLFDPAFTDFKRIETLIIESTYGGEGNIFPHRRDVDAELLNSIYKTMERGGKVLIPSFAVGRGQEIMALLGSQETFPYPVYLEGMIYDATAIHTAYPEYLSRRLQREIFHKGKNPLVSNVFKNVSPKERNSIIDSGEPAVIIATSGMLIGGPSVEYLKGLAHDPKNTLMFSGYQAEGTLGRRIQKGWAEVPINEEGKKKTLKIEMEIKTIEGISGHADRNELLKFISRLTSKPERIIVNHGEKARSIDLAHSAHKIFHIETDVPKNLDSIRLK